MISLFKPTSRLLSIAAAALVLAVVCVTFTGAAQKQKSKAQTPPEPVSLSLREKALRTLEMEMEKIQVQIDQHEKKLEQLRHELRIPSHIASGDGNQPGPDNETLRKLEGLRIETQTELMRMSRLIEHLARLPRAVLRKTIQTAAPDQQLTLLLDRLAEVEQKLASLTGLYSADHHEVKALARILKMIDQQVDDRLDGIMAGLKMRRDSALVQESELLSQIKIYKQFDLGCPHAPPRILPRKTRARQSLHRPRPPSPAPARGKDRGRIAAQVRCTEFHALRPLFARHQFLNAHWLAALPLAFVGRFHESKHLNRLLR